jgi:hypothetical protein
MAVTNQEQRAIWDRRLAELEREGERLRQIKTPEPGRMVLLGIAVAVVLLVVIGGGTAWIALHVQHAPSWTHSSQGLFEPSYVKRLPGPVIAVAALRRGERC